MSCQERQKVTPEFLCCKMLKYVYNVLSLEVLYESPEENMTSKSLEHF